MTQLELARKLAELEGVEHHFDMTVKSIIAARRREISTRMMDRPGRTPAEVVNDADLLETALAKIDHNIRSQYETFLAAHSAARAAAFTVAELRSFIETLQQQPVREYHEALRRSSVQMSASVNAALTSIIRSAITQGG